MCKITLFNVFFVILTGPQQFTVSCATLNSASEIDSYQNNANSSLRWGHKNHKRFLLAPNIFNAKVGLYVKDYSGKTVQMVGETNATSEVMVLTLPALKVEDHIWDGKSITLECESSEHPVFWEYDGLGNPQVRVTTERKSPNFYDTSSYSYKSVVTFASTNHKQTGKYTCRPSDSSRPDGDDSGGVSVYLFVPGKMLFVLDNNEDSVANMTNTILVSQDRSSPWVTLPCAPSVKDAIVELYALGSQSDIEQKQLKESKHLKYDPMEGFKLQWTEIEKLVGIYRCVGKLSNSTTEADAEQLLIKLIKPNNTTIHPTRYGNDSEPHPQLSIGYNSTTNRIECCTPGQENNKQPPQMKLSSCVSISDCHFSSQLFSPKEFRASVISRCSQGWNGSKDCESDPFMKLVNSSCVAYKLPESTRDAGLLKCFLAERDPGENIPSGNILVSELQFSFTPNFGLGTNFGPDSVETPKILEMGREQKDEPKAVYFCNPDPFYFSTGIKWATEMKNDTDEGGLQFLNESDGRPSLEVDETKVELVYCFAPIWNSTTAWRNVSMRVPHTTIT